MIELNKADFGRAGPPAWVYYDLARAWAGLGDLAQVLAHLRTAAGRGWDDWEELASCPEFAALPESSGV